MCCMSWTCECGSLSVLPNIDKSFVETYKFQLFTLTTFQINTLTETFTEMDAIVTKAEIAALPKKAED